jgi:hypothetical protein
MRYEIIIGKSYLFIGALKFNPNNEICMRYEILFGKSYLFTGAQKFNPIIDFVCDMNFKWQLNLTDFFLSV